MSPVAGYAVPLEKDMLIVSGDMGVVALVNEAACEHLARNADREDESVALLRQALAASEGRFPDRRGTPLDPVFLGILPTRACNGACRYCAFGAQTAPERTMSLEMAVAAVDWFVDHTRRLGKPSFAVHFFGGEPFVAPRVVEAAVYRARILASRYGLHASFQVATNGVFDEATAAWISNHFDTVVLSLDGPRPIHDRNRPLASGEGSWDAAVRTGQRLAKSRVELCIRVCVTAENVTMLEAIADWAASTFEPTAIDFEPLRVSTEASAEQILAPDPYAFAEHAFRAARVARARGTRAVVASADISEGMARTCCPAFGDGIIVSPDGRISACYLPQASFRERGLDLDVGHLIGDRMELRPAAIDEVRRLAASAPGCETCFCRPTCAGGCLVNRRPSAGDSSRPSFCIATRILTACAYLTKLGEEERIEALFANRAALERLATAANDRLERRTG